MAATAEQCRDMRRVRSLQDIGKDLSYALRLMAKSPGFTAAAVLSLAFGIGATTATFGVMDTLMLRTLPVRNPEQLVMFFESRPTAPGVVNVVTSYQDARKYGDLTAVFEDVAAVSLTNRSNVETRGANGGSSEVNSGQARVALVSGNYFGMLGINARLGRVLTPDDDRVPGGQPVVVISDAYWERRFARSPEALGSTLALNGITYTIVGSHRPVSSVSGSVGPRTSGFPP
jgi:hypothetical protein